MRTFHSLLIHHKRFFLGNQNSSYDALVIGSGPNGLAAAITLVLEGISVKIFEAKDTVGGGMRTQELMQPGVFHDICSAIHPMAASSPFLKQIPLQQCGLEWIHPTLPLVHPLDNEPAAVLFSSLKETARELESDGKIYNKTIKPLSTHWDSITKDILGPLQLPKHPIKLVQFGLHALQPATLFQKRFSTLRAKALFGGLAAHSILPLNAISTSAIGLVLGAAGHVVGWPFPKGGSQSLADAMTGYFKSLGGEIETEFPVKSLRQLPNAKAILFDVTPKQFIDIAGDRLPTSYVKRLQKFRYGSGVFKIDYILKEPVPWKDPACKKAGTVHLGGTFDEIAESEKKIANGKHPGNPYVLVAQQSLFDDTRTPDNRHTLWAYCHVPSGSTQDMTNEIESQIERFAPSFKDVVEQRTTMNTHQFHEYNANYIGGDINGGRQDIWQLFTRPIHLINPYATPSKGLYFCSSSTPPGGGVHGMCGYHAADLVLKREFNRPLKEREFIL